MQLAQALAATVLGLLLLCGSSHAEHAGLLSHLTAAWSRGIGSLAGLHALVKPLDHLRLDMLQPSTASSVDPAPDDTDFADEDDASVHAHWALLIAGSNGWGNYRHQSDVCHAYQVLRKGGYHPSRIVVMVYNDIANNPMNPYPGKIHNRPGGPNVYEGLEPDYTGSDVTAETFLAVLLGDASAVKGKGNGKVIASGPNDRVFVFYSDHGAPGILGMPSGGFLYADQFLSNIKAKHDAKGYKEMVLYIEACESGSMFEGLLDSHQSVYAVSAANSEESSWGTYCPDGDRSSEPDFLGTCLGDLFSVAWMENAEDVDLRSESLLIQFFLVRLRTSNNFTYVMGSHAMQFGNMKMQKESSADYEGSGNTGPAPQALLAAMGGKTGAADSTKHHRHHAVKQRDADLEPLRHAYAHAQDAASKAQAKAALDQVLEQRRAVDAAIQRAAAHLLRKPQPSQALMRTLGLTATQLFTRGSVASQKLLLGGGGTDNALMPDAGVVSLLVSRPLPGRRQGAPVVDSWECLRAMVGQWQDSCGPMDQYAMRHTRFFANLCNAGVEPVHLGEALAVSGCIGGGVVAA